MSNVYAPRGRRVPGRHHRHVQEVSVAELVGLLLKIHRVLPDVRLHCVGIYWRRIVGDRIASRTSPHELERGATLKVYAATSSWMHELQFHRAAMLRQINDWIDAQRVWLGEGPFVSDLRFVLGAPRSPLIDKEELHKMVLRSARKPPPPDRRPPAEISELDLAAIRAVTALVQDDDLRTLIESVRTKWNR